MGLKERRIKRRLVRAVVDDNVGLIDGRLPAPPKRGGRLGRSLRTALLVVAPLALLASSLVLSGAVGSQLPEAELAEVPEARATPAAASEGVATASASAAAPRPASSDHPAADPAAPDAGEDSSEGPEGPALLERQPVDAAVFPLEVRRIVLDPGHGGENLGTKTPGGLEEKLLTLDIARRVEEVLAGRGFEVVMTRGDDRSVTLQERAALANRIGADIFVSVHVNWLVKSRESGIETYFLGPTDDPYLTELAARENRESGHTMAEMRELLEGIYAGVRNDKSRELASAVHRSLVGTVRKVNPNVRDRGVKSAPFLVLVDTDMPAVLAEVAALSNAAEAAMLEKPLYRAYIADALAAGIIDYAESLSPAPSAGVTAP